MLISPVVMRESKPPLEKHSLSLTIHSPLSLCGIDLELLLGSSNSRGRLSLVRLPMTRGYGSLLVTRNKAKSTLWSVSCVLQNEAHNQEPRRTPEPGGERNHERSLHLVSCTSVGQAGFTVCYIDETHVQEPRDCLACTYR